MTTYRVTWSIDVEADSPREAAADVYRRYFNREPSLAVLGDACAFTVQRTSPGGLRAPVEIDRADG